MFITTAILLLAPSTPAATPEAAAPLEPLAAPLYLLQDEAPKWTGSVNLGATISSGNSDNISAYVDTDNQKEWDKERLSLKASWLFAQQATTAAGVTTTDVTQRRWNASAKYDHFISEKFYEYASINLENDDLAQLHLRSIVGLGAGYKFIQEEALKFEGEAGLAYVQENYASTGAGIADADDDFTALRLAYKLEKVISETTTFTQTAEAFPSLGFSEVNGTLDSRLKTKLSDSMNAMIQWIAKYNNNAPVGVGSTDSLWIFSLGWDY